MEDELIFDGKKYILASRAAKNFGYNPDYIGQMCRKGQLDCRMVGRLWFVAEDSLLKHKETAAQSVRGIIKPSYSSDIPAGFSNSKLSENTPPVSRPTTIPDAPRHVAKSVVEERGLAFFGVDHHMIGTSNEEEDRIRNRRFGAQVLTVLAAIMVFVLVAQFSLIGGFMNSEDPMHFSQELPLNLHAQVLSAFEYLDEKLNILVGKETVDRPPVANKGSPPGGGGLIVLPASQNLETNEQVKQYVEQSFSDEVVIEPDDDQESGVIRPVFRNQSDQEYMYVMVPVK